MEATSSLSVNSGGKKYKQVQQSLTEVLNTGRPTKKPTVRRASRGTVQDIKIGKVAAMNPNDVVYLWKDWEDTGNVAVAPTEGSRIESIAIYTIYDNQSKNEDIVICDEDDGGMIVGKVSPRKASTPAKTQNKTRLLLKKIQKVKPNQKRGEKKMGVSTNNTHSLVNERIRLNQEPLVNMFSRTMSLGRRLRMCLRKYLLLPIDWKG